MRVKINILLVLQRQDLLYHPLVHKRTLLGLQVATGWEDHTPANKRQHHAQRLNDVSRAAEQASTGLALSVLHRSDNKIRGKQASQRCCCIHVNELAVLLGGLHTQLFKTSLAAIIIIPR